LGVGDAFQDGDALGQWRVGVEQMLESAAVMVRRVVDAHLVCA
jgi:hypothetical protein